MFNMNMVGHQYRSPFGDTTLTKVFVGGLAWETPTEEMRRYFEQFGEILEAVIITDKASGKSKGYGFVTFRDPDSARRACEDSNPMIDGRRANCNIAAFGRPRPSPPRGRNRGGQPDQGGGTQQPATSYGRMPAPPPPPPPPQFIYPPYGYATYSPEYGYHQSVYNPQIAAQYYNQMYGTSSSAVGPYHYSHAAAYPFQSSGPSFSVPQPQRHQLPPPYLQYPSQGESFVTLSTPPYSFPPPPQIRQPPPLPDEQQPPPQSSTTGVTEASDTSKRS